MANEEKLGKIAFASHDMVTLTMPRHMLVQWPGVAKVFTLDLGKFDATLVAYGFAHGVKQKAGDQFGAEKARSPEAREAIIEATLEQLLSGEWNKKGRGEGAAPRLPDTFEAFLCTREGLTSDAHKWIKANASRGLSTTNADDVKKVVFALAKAPTFADKVKHLRGVYNAKVKAAAAVETLDLDLDI